MPKILIALPYSGRGVSGGVSVLNAKLTEAMSKNGHEVVLLHMSLPEQFAPRQDDHHNSKLIAIKNVKSSSVTGPSASDEERKMLYDLLLSAVTEADSPVALGLPSADQWSPDVIIGHSRFSGPAAIQLKRFYPEARVAYFLHSVPVEGTFLTGTADLTETPAEVVHLPQAWEKLIAEMGLMPHADVVVGVGPLLRQAAQGLAVMGAILARRPVPAVHEFIPGADMLDAVQAPGKVETLRLLLPGRGYASIKGVDDAIHAVIGLHRQGFKVELRVRGFAKDPEVAQKWANEVAGVKTAEENPVKLLGTTKDIAAEYRAAHAVLMPSHFEHFGLVPFEAAAYGVPVLVCEDSGAAMFLADQSRVPAKIGLPCIVRDSGRSAVRPMLWAKAIRALYEELPTRFENAAELRVLLTGYTWQHAAESLVKATMEPGPRIQLTGTVQTRNGNVEFAKSAL